MPPGPVRVSSRTESSARRSAIVRQLRLPAHERGRLVRKPAAAARGCDQRREAGRQRRMGELEDALGAAESLQLVLAHVLQGGAVRQLVGDERSGGRRQQHLAAMAGGHDARGPVEGRTEVVALALGRLAGVQTHPDAERSGLAPRLAHEVLLCVEAWRRRRRRPSRRRP